MPVHSFHIFDRKGKTLFTKRYVKAPSEAVSQSELAEQRKLVFGMLFSLREVAASLAPPPPPAANGDGGDENNRSGHSTHNKDGNGGGGLHSVKTGASTLYHYETNSGMHFALFVTAESASSGYAAGIRQALAHAYNELWIRYVTQSPLYNPTKPNVKETNFENQIQEYFASQPWFK